MDKINVLVLSPIGEENMRRIRAVSPRVNARFASKLWDVSDLIKGKRSDDFSSPGFDAELAEAEVLYGYIFPSNVVERAPKLKWIQGMLAGAEHLLTEDLLRSKVIIANTSGIHGTPVGEIAVEMMLILAKKALKCFQEKSQRKWESFTPDLLRGRTAGIIGLGAIGSEIARLSRAFGMRVLGVRRSVKKVGRARYVDAVYPPAQLTEMLTQSDFVVLVLPNTPETFKMIGEKELRSMKPTAYLINVGRGQTVDEEMMVRALEEGWIAGAGLDAFTVEPLPLDSKLWGLPNVFFSPHVAGRMEHYGDMATGVFVENLKRYVEGKKLRKVVSKKRGY